MKKSATICICKTPMLLLALGLLVTGLSAANCGPGTVTISQSNFVEDQAADRPTLGPVDSELFADLTAAGNDPEVEAGLTSNVPADGQMSTGNEPVELTVPSGYSLAGVSSSNSFIINADGRVLYTRYLVDENTVTLIPQVRLQPGQNYTAVYGGIRDAAGEETGFVVLHFSTPDLDYGLYFCGGYGLCEKYFPGFENAFYDASRQTVIFAHGWQAGAVTQQDAYGRDNFRYEIFYWSEDSFNGDKSHNGLRRFTNHGWLNKGWNTGIVYWNQFADEPAAAEGNLTGVHAAEAKIWNFGGPNGDRYRTIDQNGNAVYRDFDRQARLYLDGEGQAVDSVCTMLALPVVDALSENSSGNLRMVGHSLGNQVASCLSGRLYDAGVALNRVALLDPAWTNGAKDYLPLITAADTAVTSHRGVKALSGDSEGRRFWPGEMVRTILFKLMNAWTGSRNFAVEIYHTTALNLTGLPVMDANKPLTSQVADVNSAPWYYSATQVGAKHVSIRHTYFWSMESAAPLECTINWLRQRKKTGEVAASAATSDARLRAMMDSSYTWTQVEGRNTPDPADDWFERKKR